jgi:hypothetical protein
MGKLLYDLNHYLLQVLTGMDLFSGNREQVDDETLASNSKFIGCIKTEEPIPRLMSSPKKTRSSMQDLSMLDAWELSQDSHRIRAQPDRCKEAFLEAATWSLDPWDCDLGTKVNVDLSATDEQIRKDFDHLL